MVPWKLWPSGTNGDTHNIGYTGISGNCEDVFPASGVMVQRYLNAIALGCAHESGGLSLSKIFSGDKGLDDGRP